MGTWNCVQNVIFESIHNIYWAGEAQLLYCLTTYWTNGRSGFDPRQKQKNFSSSLFVQTGSEAHPASYSIGTGGPFLEGKARQGRHADHSPLSSAEVKNE
jgi:hypothetical protein